MKRILIVLALLMVLPAAARAQEDEPRLPGGLLPAITGSEDPADMRDFRHYKGHYCAPYCSEFRLGYRWADKQDARELELCKGKTAIYRRGCEARVKDVVGDKEKTFHGLKCDPDCADQRAGYAWAQKNAIKTMEACDDGDSKEFIEGCLAWVNENGETTYEIEKPR